jgi:hypothetical protein
MSNLSILNYLQDFMENIRGGEQSGGAPSAEELEFNTKILPLINTYPDDHFKSLLERYYGTINDSDDLLTKTVIHEQEEFRTHQVRIVQKMLEKINSTDATPKAAAYAGGVSFAGGYAGGYIGGIIGGRLPFGERDGNKKYSRPFLVAFSVLPSSTKPGPGPGPGPGPRPGPKPPGPKPGEVTVIFSTTPLLLEIIKQYIQYQTGEDQITDKILTDLTAADIGVFDVEFPKIPKSNINKTFVVDLCEILVEKYNSIKVQSVQTNIVDLRESIIENLFN